MSDSTRAKDDKRRKRTRQKRNAETPQAHKLKVAAAQAQPGATTHSLPALCQGNLEMSHREQLRNVILMTFLGARWESYV